MSLASALVAAQRSGVPFSAASLPAVPTVEAAEAIQAEVAAELGASAAGWKVGFTPEGAIPVAAPIFGNLVLPDGGRCSRGASAFFAVEIEIGFRLAADLGPAGGEAALGAAFVGIEIVRSRFVEGPKVPFPSFLADNIANGGYVVGAEREDWRTLDIGALRCRVFRDETLVHDAIGGHPQGHPLAPIRALRERPVAQLGGLRAGQIVTTGTLCGVLRIGGPCRIRAELEGFGTVSLAVTE
jgi:2-keto-4-pentenoate hydratase